ncbi:MAG TPA: MFS transporter, partial [Spirochaetota bacterium]|nr:MFS transporter [Spirochaetota bacterium]
MNRNIYLLYNFKFFRDFLLIAPVIIPFYKDNNLSAFQILLVQAVFSASMLLFEIPSGYFSDRCGRKRTLVAGGIA